MPATAARWGRAPASRRAAISTSAAVRTLTTAWARAALDGHRGGPRNASVGWQPRRQRHRRGDGQRAPRMSHIAYSAGMNKPPGRYDVTVRVAKDDGRSPDPAAFAPAASGQHPA
jgi:hypothetical protein